MQPMPHQLMGYDRAITMFSPDGRLLQVEYAKKTVKQGTTAMGLVCKDGVVLVADKRIVDKLMVPEAVEKVFQVDEHIGATLSGLISDGRILIERAQLKAQQHRVTFDSCVDVLTIVKEISDLKQMCTQSGGLRPFGVSVMFAGIDETGPKLFVTEPSGIYFRFKATVIGENDEEINEILQKEYKESMSVDEAAKLAVNIMKKVAGTNFKIENLDIAVIKTPNNIFEKLENGKIKELVK